MTYKFTTITLSTLMTLGLGAEAFSQVSEVDEPVVYYENGSLPTSSYKKNLFDRPVITHAVLDGQTVYNISKSYCISRISIINSNTGLKRPLTTGQVLTIPLEDGHCYPSNQLAKTRSAELSSNGYEDPNVYVVKNRDTLYRISKFTCVGISVLKQINGKENFEVSLGEKLKLSDGHCYEPEKLEDLAIKQAKETQLRVSRLTPTRGVAVGSIGDRFEGTGLPKGYTGTGTVFFMPNNTSRIQEKYSGQILDGKAHGQGTYVTDQGVKLSGKWSQGVLDFNSAACLTHYEKHCGLSVMFERPQYHLFDLSTALTKNIRIDSVSFDFSKYEDKRRQEQVRLNPPKPKEVHTEAPSGFAALLANKDVQNALINGGNSYYGTKTEDARERQKIANDKIRRKRERDFQNEQNRQLQIKQAERAQKQRETEREVAESSKRMQRDIESGNVTPTHGSIVNYQGGGTEQPSDYGTENTNENDFAENSNSTKDDGCYKIPRTCVTTELDRTEKKTTLWVKNHCGTRMYKTTCLYDTSGKDWCEADWLPADSRKQHYSYNKEITERYKVEVVGSNKGANDWICASKDELVETFRN